jgi:dCMP deaminase
MVEPRQQPTEPISKHAFKPGTMVSRGGVVFCDVPGCGMPLSSQVHHAIEKGPDEILPASVPRISREGMLISVAEVVRQRSTCLRGQVGVVIAQNGRIVAMGYNGAPPGMPHCTEVGCDELTIYEAPDPEDKNERRSPGRKVELGCQRAIHAEANAIAWAARAGVSVSGGTMYTTHSPCQNCAMLIVSCGIATVHYVRPYRAERLDILEAGRVKVSQFRETP